MTRRIVHLSDLHFGRIREDLVDPLVEAVNALEPDVVAVSGDLTQRARNRQFAQARAFLDRLQAPVTIVVPGNHDVPLDNLGARMLTPFRRYKRHIDRVLEPAWEDAELSVLGVNSVNPMAWQSGKLGWRALWRIRRSFDAAAERMRVVVLHHPLVHPPGVDKHEMRGAARAAGSLGDSGADIVLCGHLHTWRADSYRTAGETGRGTLLVQAGTGLSSRVRGEGNDFNLLTVEGPRVMIDRFAAAELPVFERQHAVSFLKREDAWQRLV